MKISFIIVAGGKGTRMHAEKPKQYLELYDKPVIMETLANVSRQLENNDQVVLVVPPDDKRLVQRLVRHFFMRQERFPKVEVTGGGTTRAESVMNGLKCVPQDTDYISVHDGVRPFVNSSLFKRLFEAVMKDGHGSVLPALPSDDSIRIKEGEKYRVVPRNDVYRIQTPQIFEAKLFRKSYEAYAESPDTSLTDDASVVSEMSGIPPFIVPGLHENIKITNPVDLAIAKVIAGSFDATK